MFWFHWFYRLAECAVLTYVTSCVCFLFHLLLPHDLRQGLASCFCRGADGHCVRLWNSNTPCTVCEACTICRQVGVAGLHKTVFGGCEVYQVFTYQAILSFDLKKAFKNTKSMIVCQPLLLLLSRFSSVRLCVTPQMAAHQAPPSLGFSRQEHWSGLPFPSPIHESEKWKWSCSVISDSERPHGLQPTRFLRPWDFPGKSTGVGCHCLLRCQPLA